MTKTIVALYDDFSTAERVIDNLIEAGFTRDDISVMANDASGEYSSSLEDRDMVLDGDVSAGEGAGFGAVIGTLIGVGVSLIPGIGPVIGAGPLAIALTAGIGAAAGAITGGITAGLIDMGVDEDDAHVYAEGIRRGGTLVSLTTNDEWAERAETIMNRYHPVDIDTRSSLWREGGWSNFDHAAPPYNAEQIERERLAYRDYNVPRGMGSIPEEDVFSDQQPRASTDTVPTTGGIPRAGNSETMQRASVEADMERGPGASGTPGGRAEDRSAPAVTDYDSTSGGRWAAEEATRAQNEHAAKMGGAIPHSQVGATSSSDVSAGATPPGTERHHETSHAVDQAMRRDTTGSEYATPEEEIEANRRARAASEAIADGVDEAEDYGEGGSRVGDSEPSRRARAYARSANLPDPNPTDTSHLNR